jgi:hypothetical protein
VHLSEAGAQEILGGHQVFSPASAKWDDLSELLPPHERGNAVLFSLAAVVPKIDDIWRPKPP